MSRLVPFPFASAGLLGFWLLLNQSLSLGHILLGTALALVGGWVLATLELPNARTRRLGAIIRLAGLVVADIVRSNIAVARIILGLQSGERHSGFVEIPLELRDPYGLAALACIMAQSQLAMSPAAGTHTRTRAGPLARGPYCGTERHS